MPNPRFPLLSADTDQARCPLCSYPLLYVERLLVEETRPLVSVEVDQDVAADPILMPNVAEVAERETLEVLSACLQCSSADCGYRWEGAGLGEADVVAPAPDAG